jgi:hypothetical protein
MASQGERIVAGELVATTVLVTVRELSDGKVPKPHRFLAVLILYGALSAVALFGEEWAKASAALGGLALLAVLMGPPGDPTLPKEMRYFRAMVNGPGFTDTTPSSSWGGSSNPLDELKALFGGLLTGPAAGIPGLGKPEIPGLPSLTAAPAAQPKVTYA